MRRLRSNRRPVVRLENPAGRRSGEEEKGHDWTVKDGDEQVAGAAQGSTTTFKGVYSANGPDNRGVHESSQPDEYLRRHGADIGDGGSGQRPPPAPFRLGKFLQRASVVMETLCEENLLHASVRAGASPVSSASGGDGGGDDREGRLLFSRFPAKGGEGWEEVAGDGVAYGLGRAAPEQAAVTSGSRPGQEEKRREADASAAATAAATASGSASGGLDGLLKGSEVVGVDFSRVKRSMLVTAHARPAGRRRRGSGRSSGDGADEGVDNSDDSGGGGGGGGGEAVGERGAALEGSGVICVWNTDNVKVRVGGGTAETQLSVWWGCQLSPRIGFPSCRGGKRLPPNSIGNGCASPFVFFTDNDGLLGAEERGSALQRWNPPPRPSSSMASASEGLRESRRGWAKTSSWIFGHGCLSTNSARETPTRFDTLAPAHHQPPFSPPSPPPKPKTHGTTRRM